MVNALDKPDDIEALKALLHEKEQEIEKLNGSIACFKVRVDSLQEQLNLLLAKRFGPSSEKTDKQQLGLFNEAEAAEPAEEHEAAEEDSVTVPAHRRNKPGRKPLPDYIERVEVLHDLPEAEKVCPHDGTTLERIGEETSEQLDIIPAQVRVLRHVRPKYACPCCREGVKTAIERQLLWPVGDNYSGRLIA